MNAAAVPSGVRGVFLSLMLVSITTSCASVPQEAVILSNLVGTQIAQHRASHEEFVRLYYARSRDVVESFLKNRWVPEYLDRFVAQSRVMELLLMPDEVFDPETVERLLDEVMSVSGVGEARAPLIVEAVARVLGDGERGQIMLDFAEVALLEIEAQRRDLLDPLFQEEERALAHLAESYGQLQHAQTQVTAYLASAREVTRSQDEVLEAMGVRDIRDEGLRRAVWISERLAAAAQAGSTAAEALEEMKKILESEG